MAYIQRAEEAEEPPIGSRACSLLFRFSLGSAADARTATQIVGKDPPSLANDNGETMIGGEPMAVRARAISRRRYNYFRSFNLTVQYGLLSTPLQGLDGARTRGPRAARARASDPRSLENGNLRGRRALANRVEIGEG